MLAAVCLPATAEVQGLRIHKIGLHYQSLDRIPIPVMNP